MTEIDLTDALAHQAETGERLGEILSARGLVDPLIVGAVLADSFGVDFVDLEERTIDPTVLHGVTEAFARRHHVLPIELKGDVLLVAMADPKDVFVLDDLRSATGIEIRPALADARQLAVAIDRMWGAGRDDTILRLATEEVEEQVTSESLAQVHDDANDGPVVQFVNQLLIRAVQERVSDVHIEPTRGDVRVRFRIDGVLADVLTIPRALQNKVTSRLKLMGNVDISEKRNAQDGRFSLTISGRPISIRVVTLPTPHGESMVLRVLEESTGLLDLDQLGFHPSARARYEAAFHRPWGAILVTGPTGSGKSTTLYATLAEINDPGRNIVTVEDPIEYTLEGIKQVQLAPRAGLGFASALRAILRSDPDVVLVGEIRDLETARIATEAALTGHLMLSTLHTNNAASAAMRLVEMGVEPFLVISTLTCIVAQRLARRLCDRCKEPYHPTRLEVEETFGSTDAFGDAEPALYRSVGCKFCSDTGYRGRIAIQEVLPVTEDISQLVLARSTAYQIEAVAVEQGMRVMREDGLLKARSGATSVREVLRAIG